MYSTPAYTRALRAYPSVVVSDYEDEDNPNEDTSETPTASPTNQASSTPEGASNYRQTTHPRPTTFEPPIDTIRHCIEPEEDQMEGQLSPQQLYELLHHQIEPPLLLENESNDSRWFTSCHPQRGQASKVPLLSTRTHHPSSMAYERES